MHKTWTLDVSGATHRLDVDWDLISTSRGEARVDGSIVRAWLSGVKFPGVTEAFDVAGHTVTVRQGLMNFDLDLRASPDVRVLAGPAPYSGKGRNISARDGLIFGLVITVALIVLVAAALLFSAVVHHTRP